MCNGERALAARRHSFWAAVSTVSDVRPPTLAPQAASIFRALLTDTATVHLLAELVFHVVQVYEEYRLLWPDLAVDSRT